MYIPNNNAQYYPLCRIKLMVETFEHSTKLIKQSKVPKDVKLMFRKHYYKTLGTSVINSPLSPLSLQQLHGVIFREALLLNKDVNIHRSEALKSKGRTNELL